MARVCLFADDAKTAEYLISVVRGGHDKSRYVGVALFPEAGHIFNKYGLKSVVLDDFITREDHERNGIEASNYIFKMGEKLGLCPQEGHSFNFEKFDLLHSFHFVNYEIIGHIFYYLTTLSNAIKEIKAEEVYTVDLRLPLKLPVNQRPRSLFTKCLANVCEQSQIPINLIGRASEGDCEDAIPGLAPSYYKYRNNRMLLYLPKIIEAGFYNRWSVERLGNVLPGSGKSKVRKTSSGPAILYVGKEFYFRKIIKEALSVNLNNICLDHISKSQRPYMFKRGNLIRTNMAFLLREFLSNKCLESIDEYNKRTKEIYKFAVNNLVKSNFCFMGIYFYNILMQYLKLYVDKGFSENLKIYTAVKEFSKKFNVRFALGYCGWTIPGSFSIHEGLRANNVTTAFMSHGMNVVNKDIVPIIKGDGILYPCDVFLSPGTEMIKGHVGCGLKDDKDNFVTGFPYYSSARRIKKPALRSIVRKVLGLDSKKKIVLYPLTKGAPHIARPNAITFVEEYNFVRKLIEEFSNDGEFQLVVKSKHYSVPDRSFLRLFHDNFPNVVLRYGPIKYFLEVADVVINFHSSCGFDAVLAGIPVIYFKPNDRYDWFHPYASTDGKKNFFFYAKSFEEIVTISRNIVDGRYPEWYKEKVREAREKFMISEGDDAAEKVMKIVCNYLKSACDV